MLFRSSEVHNEDFHYSRLMAGFIQESDTLHIPISTYDSNLESLLFLNLFTDGREYFHDLENLPDTDEETRNETYGQYIKSRLMNVDAR